jgi:hypothetical protein
MLERGSWHESLTDKKLLDAVKRRRTSLDDPGFCLACGAEAHGVDPDARGYVCQSCEAPQVYGIEEMLLSL